MRLNEYNSLDEFINEYTGEWNPSGGHWLGLDFIHNGKRYRLHTGAMYNSKCTILPDGKEAVFGIYKFNAIKDSKGHEYSLIGEYSDMESLLDNCIIDGRKFRDIIMDDNTQMTGKD